MNCKGGLQGFAWHVEYIPVWKLGLKSKPKLAKPKQTSSKHEWIDWSQFRKYQKNTMVGTN